MYELVQKKSKGRKILIGVVVFIFLSAFIRELGVMMRPTIDDELVKIANEINTHTPIIVDSTTRLNNVSALPGKVFLYNYSLVNTDPAQIDTTLLIQFSKESLVNRLKTFPQAKYFRENDIELRVYYTDEKDRYLCRFSVVPGEY
jgi:hypothetical protein